MNKILDIFTYTDGLFIIPTSSGAFALHARIISPDKLGVFSRAQSEAMKNFTVS